MLDILIVGGGPAGLTSALYAARAGKSVAVCEKGFVGGQIVFSPLVENYPGIAHISGEDLAALLSAQVEALGVTIRYDEVTSGAKTAEGFDVTAGEENISARAVILATGVAHKGLGLPGEEDLVGCGLSYCAVCDGAFCSGQDVAVIGGGDTALQDAIFLASLFLTVAGIDPLVLARVVYLIHRRDAFRAEQRLVRKAADLLNVRFLYDTVATEYLTEEGSVTGLMLRNVKTGAVYGERFGGVFLAVGQKPENDFVKGLVAMTPDGYLYSDETALTGISGIFAAGDCRTKEVRQLTTVVSDGACAALAACRYLDT